MEDIRIVFSNIMEKLLKQAHKNKNVLEIRRLTMHLRILSYSGEV